MKCLFYRVKAIHILTFFCLSLQTFAQGGPPMITDDPGTVDKGHLEINSGITAEHTASETSIEFPFIDINYGVSARQHINFEVPLVSRYVQGEGTDHGIGKMGIGTKFRFVDQDSAGIAISTHPACSFVLSNNAVTKGVIDEGTEFFLPLEFQKDYNQNSFGIELGRLINTKTEDSWTYGALYAREFNARINAAVEVNGTSNTNFSESTMFLNVGARMTITSWSKLLFSAGKTIILPKGNEDVYIGYLALQVAI